MTETARTPQTFQEWHAQYMISSEKRTGLQWARAAWDAALASQREWLLTLNAECSASAQRNVDLRAALAEKDRLIEQLRTNMRAYRQLAGIPDDARLTTSEDKG